MAKELTIGQEITITTNNTSKCERCGFTPYVFTSRMRLLGYEQLNGVEAEKLAVLDDIFCPGCETKTVIYYKVYVANLGSISEKIQTKVAP